MDFEAAAAYAERHALHALMIRSGARVVFERYADGYDGTRPHALYSGTKSFWGVAAVAAQADGLLELDERVAQTIPAWADDPDQRAVTLRHLLTLTSGIGFGGLGAAVPLYAKALDVTLKNAPGGTFTYGGIPLQVFGAVLAAKLGSRGLTPHAYLRERILDPIGVQIGSWRSLKDGTQPLPTGAFLAAAEWLKFGACVRDGGFANTAQLIPANALAQCFEGTPANARYGLTWWLSPLPAHPDIAYASGSGGQALYVIPSADLVVVKFGASSSYKHETFLQRLLR